jgi:hypothetical protein
VNSSRKPRIPTEHARHDRLIVTRYAGDDAYPTEVEEAREMVGTCTECARLADDIRLLMAATSELPAPRRPRDFRLTPEQAESLRGSFLERLLRPLATPRLAILRPVAGVAMSLGLALAVAGAALPTVAPASAPESERMMLDGKGGDSPALAPGAAAPGAEAEGEGQAEDQGQAEDPIDEAYTADQLDATARAELSAPPVDQTRSLVLYAGLVLAAFSLAILIIVTFARRRAYDRLLR